MRVAGYEQPQDRPHHGRRHRRPYLPGLAVAEEPQARGWRVHWLGTPGSMESRIVPQHGLPLETIDFSGVRGKGVITLALLPLNLLRAFWQALAVVRACARCRHRHGRLCHLPRRRDGRGWRANRWLLHEQNSVRHGQQGAGGHADRIFTAFPACSKKASGWATRCAQAFRRRPPAERFAGPHRATANCWWWAAAWARARAQRHRAPGAGAAARGAAPAGHTPGAKVNGGRSTQLRANYQAAGVQAELTPFIDDTAAGVRRGRRHRLPRRRQHRDRDRRRGRGRGVRAVSACGGRPPDHERPLSRRCGRRLAGAAARPDAAWLGRYAIKYGAFRAFGAGAEGKNMQNRGHPARWCPPARSWHETRHSSHPLRRHRRLGHERHCRGAAQPGLQVSGSDLADSATLARLRALGVATHVTGHAAAHVSGRGRRGYLHGGAAGQPRGAGRARAQDSPSCRAP